jgi:hypothetical protein
MTYLHNIREVRKRKKVGLIAVSKQVNAHRDRINRIETGNVIPILEGMAKALKLNICLLTDQEVEILAQFQSILAKNGQKSTN